MRGKEVKDNFIHSIFPPSHWIIIIIIITHLKLYMYLLSFYLCYSYYYMIYYRMLPMLPMLHLPLENLLPRARTMSVLTQIVNEESIPASMIFSSSVICLDMRHLSFQNSALFKVLLFACSYLRVRGSNEVCH